MIATCVIMSVPEPVAARSDRTLSVAVADRTLAIPIALDSATIDPKGAHDVRVLARWDGIAVVLDSYASMPRSMSLCQAGMERWIRVIDTAASRERAVRLVESCLKNVVPGDPVLRGPDAAGSITIDMLSEPSFRITADGRIETMR